MWIIQYNNKIKSTHSQQMHKNVVTIATPLTVTTHKIGQIGGLL